MSRVLVTGINGFIGSHLARALLEKKHEVFGLVKTGPPHELDSIRDLLDKIAVVPADLPNYQSVLTAVNSVEPDVVIHLAAISPVRLSFSKPFEYMQTNFVGSMNVMHALMELPEYKKRRLLMASTSEVYGWQAPDEKLNENAPIRCASPYAVSKAASDLYALMAMRVNELNATLIRCTNTYGRKNPRDRSYVVENYVTLMLENKPTYLPTPKSARQYMYVDDHVGAYLACMENPGAEREVFNACPENPVTNEQLHAAVAKLTGYSQKVVPGQWPPGYPPRPAQHENEVVWLDASKIKQKIGWQPRYSLEQGLKLTVDYWKQALKNTS